MAENIFVICMCAAETRYFRQKAFTSSTSSSKIISFQSTELGDRVGSTGQKRIVRVGTRVKSSS